MEFEYNFLQNLKKTNSTLKLLNATNGAFIISFLYSAFYQDKSEQAKRESYLIENLTHYIEELNFQLSRTSHDNADLFTKSAKDYLNDWSDVEVGWLRKFYMDNEDEPYYDLMPSVEKAILWLQSLNKKEFVGANSLFSSVVSSLRKIKEGNELDPQKRIDELNKQILEKQKEIEEIKQGKLRLLDETEAKELVLIADRQIKEIFSNFREINLNLEQLGIQTKKEILLENNSHRGEVLDNILSKKDSIENSDQGKSFDLFFKFLLSPEQQEEFSELIDYIVNHKVSKEIKHNISKNIVFDLLSLSQNTQKIKAKISKQIKNFLESKEQIEHNRLVQLISNIEKHFIVSPLVELPNEKLKGLIVDERKINFRLPTRRPLYIPKENREINNLNTLEEFSKEETKDLLKDIKLNVSFIDENELEMNVYRCLNDKKNQGINFATLADVINENPVEKGITEILAYMNLKSLLFETDFNDIDYLRLDVKRTKGYFDNEEMLKIELPEVIFSLK